MCVVAIQMSSFTPQNVCVPPVRNCQPEARKITHSWALTEGVETGQIKAEKVSLVHQLRWGYSTSASVSVVVVTDPCLSASSYF